MGEPVSTPITGRAFLQALLDAGVIHPDERVRRVVIDAQINSSLIVYVERFGDKRMLQVVPALTGVEVKEVDR